MKKNLKKVISAVVALALSVSSVVALAATPELYRRSRYSKLCRSG